MKVEEPAGRGDQQIQALVPEHPLLGADRHPSDDDTGPDPREAPVLSGAGLDLSRELTRGHQHQRAQGRRAFGQPRQDREQEGGGLAGAGVRGADQIATGEDDRDRLLLDRGGSGVAGRPHAPKNRRGQPQLSERHQASGEKKTSASPAGAA